MVYSFVKDVLEWGPRLKDHDASIQTIIAAAVATRCSSQKMNRKRCLIRDESQGMSRKRESQRVSPEKYYTECFARHESQEMSHKQRLTSNGKQKVTRT